MGFEMTINYITITTIILNTPLQLLEKVTSLFFVVIEKKLRDTNNTLNRCETRFVRWFLL